MRQALLILRKDVRHLWPQSCGLLGVARRLRFSGHRRAGQSRNCTAKGYTGDGVSGRLLLPDGSFGSRRRARRRPSILADAALRLAQSTDGQSALCSCFHGAADACGAAYHDDGEWTAGSRLTDSSAAQGRHRSSSCRHSHGLCGGHTQPHAVFSRTVGRNYHPIGPVQIPLQPDLRTGLLGRRRVDSHGKCGSSSCSRASSHWS